MKIYSVISLVVAVVAVCPLQAAESDARMWANATGRAVELRWLPPTDNPFPAEGYTILRRRRGGNRTYYPIDTVVVRPQLNPSANVPAGVRDSLTALLRRSGGASSQDSRAAVEELRLAAMAHPALFATVLDFRYIDSTVKPDTLYDYNLAIGIDVIAEVTGVGRTLSAAEALRPPDMKAVAHGNSIRLSWETRGMLKQGISGWKLTRKEDGKPDEPLLVPVLATFFPDNAAVPFVFEDFGLRKGASYSYTVTAFDVFGRESKPGSPVTIAVPLKSAIAPPIGLIARTSGESVQISWQSPPRKQMQIAGFHIYRQAGNQTVKLSGAPVTDTIFFDKPGQIAAAELAYFATAVDASGNESDASFQSIVAVPDNVPPTRPSFVGITPDNGVFTVQWSRSASADAVLYEVARSAREDGTFSLVAMPTPDTTFEDAADDGVALWYKVRSVDIRGNRSDWTAPAFGKMPGKSLPPNPVITAIVSSDRRISLEWQPIAFPALAGYWVNRYDDTVFTPLTINAAILPPSLTRYDDTSGTPGVLYVYEVVAQDSNAAFSPPSPRAYGRSYDAHRPPPPLIDSLFIAELGIMVVWRWDIAPALPYEVVVERSRDGKRYVQVSPLIQPEESRYPDLAARPGETYYYRLRARNKYGVWSSPSASRFIEFAR